MLYFLIIYCTSIETLKSLKFQKETIIVFLDPEFNKDMENIENVVQTQLNSIMKGRVLQTSENRSR